jgi:hypothetical protein
MADLGRSQRQSGLMTEVEISAQSRLRGFTAPRNGYGVGQVQAAKWVARGQRTSYPGPE